MASPGVAYPTTDTEYHPLNPSSPSPPTTSIPMESYSLPNTGSRPPPPATSGYAAGGPPRTPSPTPSDIEELKKGAIDFKKLMDWRTWLKRKYLWYYVAGILATVVVALITIFHKQIVEALTPASQYLRTLPGGWSIPIGVMFVLSFPPLFGNEIVHVLCGIVWGIWIGFGIVCAGTFLGEIGNFYAFRYCCKSRGEKLEKNNLSYACLAKVVREGGFLIALIIRLSAIPGHFTTAVFSTCGMGILSFSLGAFLSLPKQFATVYIGVILHQAAGQQTTQQRILSAAVLFLTTAITIFAAWWVWKKMNAAKPAVLAERRKAKALALYNQKMYDMRNADLESASNVNLVAAGPSGKNTPYDTASSASTITVGKFNNHSSNHLWPSNANGSVDFDRPFNTSESRVNLPLSVKPQRWDAHGRAVIDNQPDFSDGSQHHNSVENEDWSRRPPPAGAKMPAVVQAGSQAQQYGGPTAPPDIRVIRASGASSNTHESLMPGRMPYDPPLTPTEVPPPASSSSPRSPPTSPTRRGGPPRSPPQASYAPGRRSEDSSESGPQWAAGVTKEDDTEAAVPLTAGLQASRTVPANMQSSPSPSYPPQHQQQPPQIMTASASQPARMQSYDTPASPYDNMALYNPYDRPQQQQQQQQQQPQQPIAGRHRWEETDATAATYHTADGSTGSPQYTAATQRQLPPPSESRQQQTPSPPGGFGGNYYQPQQYGGGGYGRQ